MFGTFWSAIVAALIASHPGATLSLDYNPAFPLDFWCYAEIYGGGAETYGWGYKLDRWDPAETLEMACDKAANDAVAFQCTYRESTVSPPQFCVDICDYYEQATYPVPSYCN